MRYIPELDGLRCLAFLAVFINHLFYAAGVPLAPPTDLSPYQGVWWMRGVALAGNFGVDLFFVLSGFLITALLLQEEARYGRINILAFWMRRILRIWPAYFVFLALAAGLNRMSPESVISFATFTANLPILVGPYALEPINLGVLWSIQIEEHFYLFWPLLLVVVPKAWRPFLGVGLLGLSLACRVLMFSAGAPLFVWTFTLGRLDALGIGVLLALRRSVVSVPKLVKMIGVALPVVLVVGAAVTSHSLRAGDPGLKVHPEMILAVIVIPTIIAVCCGFSVWAASSARWLRWWPLVHFGEISYGLYLVHATVIVWFGSLWWPIGAVASLATSVLIAEVSYRALETPFLRLKKRFSADVLSRDVRSAARYQ